jgi:hypothetical protein
MIPQGHRQFLVYLTRRLRVDIQIEAVLAIGSLVAIAPLRSIETRVVNSLIARMPETVTDTDTVPSHYGLGFLPPQVADRRGSIGNAFIHEHTRILGSDANNLTSLNGEHRALGTLLVGSTAHQQCHEWQQ